MVVSGCDCASDWFIVFVVSVTLLVSIAISLLGFWCFFACFPSCVSELAAIAITIAIKIGLNALSTDFARRPVFLFCVLSSRFGSQSF